MGPVMLEECSEHEVNDKQHYRQKQPLLSNRGHVVWCLGDNVTFAVARAAYILKGGRERQEVGTGKGLSSLGKVFVIQGMEWGCTCAGGREPESV